MMSESTGTFLSAIGVSKQFGAVRALNDVSFSVRLGTVTGLCGHNGAGKSTLIRVLMGLVRPDSGAIEIEGHDVSFGSARDAYRAGLAIADQEMGLVRELTVQENIFLGSVDESFFRSRDQTRRARDVLSLVGLESMDPSTLLGDLQPGEIKLVEIAHVLVRRPRVIILDEPTSSLSYAEARRVFAAVRNAVAQGAAVIFVSHRLDEVFELCSDIVVMADGVVVAEGAVEEFTRSRIVELMIHKQIEPAAQADAAPVDLDTDSDTGTRVQIVDLVCGTQVNGFSLDIPKNMIVGIAGQVGSGGSDVLRALAGLIPATGQLLLNGEQIALRGSTTMVGRGVHFVPNDRALEGLFLERSIGDNLTATRLRMLSRFGYVSARRRKREAKRLFDAVGVRATGIRPPVRALSGGNQQKVLIGRSLERGTRSLLLLDDPTRGVDIGGRAEIHDLIRAARRSGDAVVFVSTELDELLDLADIVVTMYAGEIVSVKPRSQVAASSVLAEMTNAA